MRIAWSPLSSSAAQAAAGRSEPIRPCVSYVKNCAGTLPLLAERRKPQQERPSPAARQSTRPASHSRAASSAPERLRAEHARLAVGPQGHPLTVDRPVATAASPIQLAAPRLPLRFVSVAAAGAKGVCHGCS